METNALVYSIVAMAFAFIFVMGARWIIRESLAKAYCKCEHEFNQHWVRARGHIYPPEYPAVEKCRECSCQAYKKNDKDKRNSPPVEFW